MAQLILYEECSICLSDYDYIAELGKHPEDTGRKSEELNGAVTQNGR